MNTLSERARHVLRRAVLGEPRGDFDEAASRQWSQTVRPAEALAQCRKVAASRGFSVHHLLMSTQGCGLLTRHELFEWMSKAGDGHVCVCRDCGRRLGAVP